MENKILAVGSIAYDSISTPHGNVDRALGGSANYFSISASNFAPIQLVGVVGEDFSKDHLEFLSTRGIDIGGVQIVPGKTFHWEGKYEGDMNEAITIDTQLNVFEHFNPELPESYKEAEYLFLGNIAPALQMSVLDQVKAPKMIALDSMNLWINIMRDKLLEVLPKIDLLIINDTEVKMLAEEENVIVAAEKVLGFGPKSLVVKRGEYGAFLFNNGKIFSAPAMPIRQVKDPTGAGDTFAGGLMGYVAKHGLDVTDFSGLKKALLHGVVMASYTVQDFSFDRLKTVSSDEIESSYEDLIKMMTV